MTKSLRRITYALDSKISKTRLAKSVFQLIFLSLILPASGQVSKNHFALTGVTLIDYRHHVPLTHQTVVIKGSQIEDVFPDSLRSLPDSITTIRLEGKYLIPGLIDSHVHLATDPSSTDLRDKTILILKRMLQVGITSVRDMAGDARTLASLARDAWAGDIPSPNIYYSALMAGPDFFSDPRTQLSTLGGEAGKMPYMRAISDSSDIRLAVAEAKGTGASGIKLYADLPASLVTRILLETKSQGIPVWAHAFLQPAKPSEIVQAGVGSISHSPLLIYEKMSKVPDNWKRKSSNRFWDDSLPDLNALFRLMIERHAILDATLITYKQWATDDTAMRYDYEIAKRLTAKAYKAGVMISAGTDMDQKVFVPEEIKLLVSDAGMTQADALDAATINAAKALFISDRTGSIEKKKQADLVVLDKNPLSNISNLESVYMVVKSGKIYQ